MTRVEYGVNSPFSRRYGCRILALCWVFGLFAGAFLFLQAGPSLLPMMRRVILFPVSIAGLFSSLLIPFLFTVFAVYSSLIWLIVPVCFAEGALLSFCLIGISQAFSSAGWMIRTLVLFRSGVCAVCTLLVWLRIFSGGKTGGWLCWCVYICAAACILDYSVISPFLASLIIH